MASQIEIDKCYDAMAACQSDEMNAVGLMDEVQRAQKFIDALLETIKKYFREYTEIPPKEVVMEAADMLMDTMLVSMNIPGHLKVFFKIFGRNAVSSTYDFFFNNPPAEVVGE